MAAAVLGSSGAWAASAKEEEPKKEEPKEDKEEEPKEDKEEEPKKEELKEENKITVPNWPIMAIHTPTAPMMPSKPHGPAMAWLNSSIHSVNKPILFD